MLPNNKPSLVGSSFEELENILMHYGTPHDGSESHSGRYEWGSGDNPYQHNKNFIAQYRMMKDQGKSDSEIAKELNVLGKKGQPSASKLKLLYSMALAQEKHETIVRVQRMHDKGMSNIAICRELGKPDSYESTIRNYLRESALGKVDAVRGTADMLKNQLKKKKYIDVGTGTELYIGVTESHLQKALAVLENEGYTVTNIKVPQATNPDVKTTVQVLGPKGSTWGEIMNNQVDIQPIETFTNDGGKTYNVWEYPSSVSSKRLKIRYGSEGGTIKDGTIEIRRGVKDLSLGENTSYAQVRIAVDGTHYMKGMAFYGDDKDFPPGVDIIYNVKYDKDTPMLGPKGNTILKPLKDNPDNPFGATIKVNGQYHYIDDNGEDKLSPINKLKEEGDWDSYSKTIASQMLAKQAKSTVKRQLALTYSDKLAQYDEIMAIENPVLKKSLLDEFATKCDTDAIKLKASPFPGQSSKVILPCNSLKDNEIYAPSYPNGTKVCLVRYPHGGIFEIPTLTVNNKNAEGKRIIGQGIDAVGIAFASAERLSGADFDGDSVVVIPQSDKVKTLTKEPLEGLKNFDHLTKYHSYPGMKVMTNTQTEMGKITNLIMDMTLKGASNDEVAAAVRHSMVVVDAEKHELDYKQSEKDNHIDALKKKYQNGGGASTLITRAKRTIRDVPEAKPSWRPDPETGEVIWTPTGRTYIDKKTGEEKLATMEKTEMELVKDAHELSSGTEVEDAYADYANKMKAMGNRCRKESMAIKFNSRDPEAAKKYAKEVSSLTMKLNDALKNAPKERMAQINANQEYLKRYKEATQNGEELKSDDKKKIKDQAITKARIKYGSDKKSVRINITDSEWEAIQNNAFSPTTIAKIIANTDNDDIKARALPKNWSTELTTLRVSQIKALANSGYTLAEIAAYVGCSPSTVSKYL